jgi:hypothetical protein
MTVRIPHRRIDTLGGRARAQVNDNRREQIGGRSLLVHRYQDQYDGVVADARLFRESEKFQVGGAELRLIMRFRDADRQGGEAQCRCSYALKKYKRVMRRLLEKKEAAFLFEPG